MDRHQLEHDRRHGRDLSRVYLLEIKTLGSLREGLLGAATDRLAPAALFEGSPPVPISIAAAALVIGAWTLVPLAVGAWRTCTRDA